MLALKGFIWFCCCVLSPIHFIEKDLEQLFVRDLMNSEKSDIKFLLITFFVLNILLLR